MALAKTNADKTVIAANIARLTKNRPLSEAPRV